MDVFDVAFCSGKVGKAFSTFIKEEKHARSSAARGRLRGCVIGGSEVPYARILAAQAQKIASFFFQLFTKHRHEQKYQKRIRGRIQ